MVAGGKEERRGQLRSDRSVLERAEGVEVETVRVDSSVGENREGG